MNVLAMAVLVHVFAIHDMQWEGAAAGWMFAVCLDTGIWGFLIYQLTGGTKEKNRKPNETI